MEYQEANQQIRATNDPVLISRVDYWASQIALQEAYYEKEINEIREKSNKKIEKEIQRRDAKLQKTKLNRIGKIQYMKNQVCRLWEKLRWERGILESDISVMSQRVVKL